MTMRDDQVQITLTREQAELLRLALRHYRGHGNAWTFLPRHTALAMTGAIDAIAEQLREERR